MNFAQYHYADVLSILAGLALGVSTIRKRWKSARGLLPFRLGALFIFAGGCLGSLHYFQNIDWVHRHHWRTYFVGWTLKNVGLGMLIVIVALGLYKDIEPDEKLSLS